MHSPTRCLAALFASIIAITCTTGCASSSTSDPVARVAGQTVTKAELEHWIPVEAIISHSPLPQQPIAKGEVPDPPHYTACIDYLRAATLPPVVNGPAAPTTAELRSQCQQRYETIRQRVLQILISYAWIRTEAAAQRIEVSNDELQHALAREKRERYGAEAGFERYLNYTDQTLSDVLFLEKFDMLSAKLTQKLIQQRGVAGATNFYREFAKKWAAKTDCGPAYIIPNCKQYRGSQPPEATI